MPRRDRPEQDRYLILRRGIYHYKRRVPEVVAALDSRAPHVRISLKTKDLAVARLKRDAYIAADDLLWASLLEEGNTDAAVARYNAAARRAEALGFTYRHARQLADQRNIPEVLERIEAVMDERAPRDSVHSVLGTVRPPPVTVNKAFEIYVSEIARDELRDKSRTQRDSWKKVKQRAIDNFIALAGNKPIGEITRQDALSLHRFWLARISPEKGLPTHTPSSGNRDIGNMRVLIDAYSKPVGVTDPQTPLAGLSCSERNPRSRPPFPDAWIMEKFLKRGLLANMNRDARGLLLAMVETGARPSELCNMPAGNIRLDAEVPHIRIAPSDRDEDPYEIKTVSSIRHIPLVGVSLAAFEHHPKGFPGFYDRHNSVTSAINKFLRENTLRPSDKHSLYSLRHSFEDRMKNGKVDHELRRTLMGHTINRPKYGSGGEMKMWQAELKRIALPFDRAIF